MRTAEGGGSSVGSSLGAAFAQAAKSTAKTAKKATAAPRRRLSTPSRSTPTSGGSPRTTYSRGGSSSGGSSRRSGGSSSGGSSMGGGSTYKAPKPVGPPSINSYLGTDSAYQTAVSGGKRSLNDFLSELGRRRGEAGTQFNQTTASMEKDRVQQLDDLRNEFASRGLINSGLYGEEQGNFQEKFTEQRNALEQQQAALLADLLSQEKNYRRENDLATQAAKQEALQRRAAKYKIGA